MVASIGKIASPAQGVSYFEKDGYYAKDDVAHREASAWAGKGAAALGLSSPVGPTQVHTQVHTQVQITARYAHLARYSIQNAAARITGSIGGNLTPDEQRVSHDAKK